MQAQPSNVGRYDLWRPMIRVSAVAGKVAANEQSTHKLTICATPACPLPHTVIQTAQRTSSLSNFSGSLSRLDHLPYRILRNIFAVAIRRSRPYGQTGERRIGRDVCRCRRPLVSFRG